MRVHYGSSPTLRANFLPIHFVLLSQNTCFGGDFEQAGIYFSQFWKLGNPRPRGRYLERAFLQHHLRKKGEEVGERGKGPNSSSLGNPLP